MVEKENRGTKSSLKVFRLQVHFGVARDELVSLVFRVGDEVSWPAGGARSRVQKRQVASRWKTGQQDGRFGGGVVASALSAVCSFGSEAT